MLQLHLDQWKKINANFVIVDDHSKKPLNIDFPNLDIYRVDDDIEWGQPGAKNLGFHVAKDDWILYFDIDHLITKEVYDKIIKLQMISDRAFYRFGRTEKGEDIGNTKSVFLIHKNGFERVGGFDEDFSGHYGWDDTLFNDMCSKRLKVNVIESIKIPCYANSFEYDGVGGLKRDSKHNKEILYKKLNADYFPGKRLRFNWHKV